MKIAVLLLLLCPPLMAFPLYLEALQADPMLKPAFPTHCGTCHINPDGGGERNRFGQFFQSQGEKITPLLRARDGVKFIYPKLKINDTMTIHFSDPEQKQFVIELPDKQFIVVDVSGQKAGRW